MKKLFKSRVIFLCLGLLLWCTSAGAEIEKGTLTFGEVYPHPAEAQTFTLPVAEYVVKHLNLPEIVKANAIVTDNIEEMATLIREKKVDILIDTLHPIIYIQKQGMDLKPILSRLKKGIRGASGVFIARKDNDSINSLNDLVGKRLTFKTIHATQAHLISRAHLLKKGYKLNYSIVDNPEEINCTFATDYFAIEDMVIKGNVDAGATSSHRLDVLAPEVKEKLKIIARTPVYPYHVVSVAPHVPSDLAKRIKEVLLHMAKDRAARPTLARYYRTTKFEEIPSNVSEMIKELKGFCEPSLHKNKGLTMPGIRKDSLVIGRVSNNPRKHYKRLKPMVDYVVSKLSDLGIKRSGVLMAKNNQEMIEYLKEGKVDWVTETPFSALLFCEQADAEIMVRRWKEGKPDYYSIFFARKDSVIDSIEDLKGRKIAFEDPGSTTGFFAPMAVLKKRGFKPVKLASPKEKPPAEGIGYVFARSDINITTWVCKGLVDAGTYSNRDWENPDDCPPAFKKNLKIIHQTGPFPRAMEIIRKGVDPEIKKRIKEVLLNAHKDTKAKKALKAYRKTRRFDEFTEKAKEQLEAARQLLEYF